MEWETVTAMALLLSFSAEHSLVITNTILRQSDKYKTYWQHPHSKQWHLLDYVIAPQRDIGDAHITREMCRRLLYGSSSC